MLTKLIHTSKRFLKRNGSTVLTCIGVAGVVGTAVMAAKATPKALALVEDAKKEKEENNEELTKFQTVVIAAPAYIPSVLIGASTIACIIGANVLNKRQQAALTSAYIMLSNSYKEYKSKLIELYGRETNDKINEEIVKDRLKCEDIVITSGGIFTETTELESLCDDDEKVLFYDKMSERYFESTIMKVYAAEYHLNRNFSLFGIATPNDFYAFLGLPATTHGDSVGWSIEIGYCWIDFDHKKAITDDGLECIVIDTIFDPEPDYDYH